MADDLLSTDQLAVWLLKPPGTLRQWRHKGYGPAGFRVGGSVRYRRSEVERWLARQEAAERDRTPAA